MNEYVFSAPGDAPSDWMEEIGSRQGVRVVANDMRLMLVKCPEEVAKKLDKEFEYLKVEYVCPDEMFGRGK